MIFPRFLADMRVTLVSRALILALLARVKLVGRALILALILHLPLLLLQSLVRALILSALMPVTDAPASRALAPTGTLLYPE